MITPSCPPNTLSLSAGFDLEPSGPPLPLGSQITSVIFTQHVLPLVSLPYIPPASPGTTELDASEFGSTYFCLRGS